LLFLWGFPAVRVCMPIGSSLGDCDEYVTDDGLAGVAGEIVCGAVDEAMTLLFLYFVGALWVFVNVIVGIVALIRRKKRANESTS